MSRAVLLWTLMQLQGLVCMSGPREVRVHAGATMTVRCEYPSSYQDYVKYWCKGQSWTQCTVMIQTENEQQVTSGRLSIQDERRTHSILVTMRDMRPRDADYYYCGLERHGVDSMHLIKVEILPGICADFSPWSHMVDIMAAPTVIYVKDLVEVSCKKNYSRKRFWLECREVMGHFTLQAQDLHSTCSGLCSDLSPWTHAVDFPAAPQRLDVNSSVEVSCKHSKNVTFWLQCRDVAGNLTLQPRDPHSTCPDPHFTNITRNVTSLTLWGSFLVSSMFGLLVPVTFKLLVVLLVLGVKVGPAVWEKCKSLGWAPVRHLGPGQLKSPVTVSLDHHGVSPHPTKKGPVRGRPQGQEPNPYHQKTKEAEGDKVIEEGRGVQLYDV